MSGDASPEAKFAADLKQAARISPAILEFIDTVMTEQLSPVDRLSNVARIAYKYGGLKGSRQAELLRVWMLHDQAACHNFLVSEDQRRLRAEQKVRELEKANQEKDVLVNTLKRKVDQLKVDLQCARSSQADADVETQKIDSH